MFLEVTLSPFLGWVGWIVVGALAGLIAGLLVRGKGYGCLMNIVVGILGAVIGGWLLSLVTPTSHTFGFVGSLIVAVLGAVLLLVVLRLVFRRG